MTESSNTAETETSWMLDPNIIVFGGAPDLPPGVAEQHGLKDFAENLFGKSREVVKANWEQVIQQMRYLLAEVDSAAHNYEMSEITFELGFSADGVIVFVAHAGITSTISVTFKRKDE
jgi:hypothetical protein